MNDEELAYIGDPNFMSKEEVKFYDNPVSEKLHVKITFPGNTRFQHDYVATAEHKRKYRQQYKAYELGTSHGGTPLSEVNWIDEGKRREFEYLQIFNIESLANLSRDELSDLGPGAPEFQAKAKEYLKNKQKIAEFDEKDKENAALKAMIKKMEERLAAVEKTAQPAKEAA